MAGWLEQLWLEQWWLGLQLMHLARLEPLKLETSDAMHSFDSKFWGHIGNISNDHLVIQV